MKPKTEKQLTNSLTDLAAAVGFLGQNSLITGGSQLSSYAGTGYANNYSLLTLNRIILTYLYTGNGIFQTAIQLPIQDAISKGLELICDELSQDDIDTFWDVWNDFDLWEKVLNTTTWKRLYGGGALLINTNQDPTKPLSIKGLVPGKTPIDFYDIDRWQLDTNTVYFDDYEGLFQSGDERELFYLWGKPIHKSRFIRMRNKRAPSYVRRQLRGWGMSEGERMIRDLNLYLKTQDVLYEILDESKVDVYKMKGLAAKLINAAGTQTVTQRVQAANQIKNYLNALVMDSEDEYEQKTMAFSGLAEVMNQNRIGIAASLRVPMTKLFGISSAGFNAGEDDLEQYNQMVESEIRTPMARDIKPLIEIVMQYAFDYVPKFRTKWPAMRVLTAEQEENVKTQQFNRIISLYDRGLMLSDKAEEELVKKDIISKGNFPRNPVPPNGPETVAPVSTAVTPKTNDRRTKNER